MGDGGTMVAARGGNQPVPKFCRIEARELAQGTTGLERARHLQRLQLEHEAWRQRGTAGCWDEQRRAADLAGNPRGGCLDVGQAWHGAMLTSPASSGKVQ
jgi:hypothetical protein